MGQPYRYSERHGVVLAAAEPVTRQAHHTLHMDAWAMRVQLIPPHILGTAIHSCIGHSSGVCMLR